MGGIGNVSGSNEAAISFHVTGLGSTSFTGEHDGCHPWASSFLQVFFPCTEMGSVGF